MPAGNYAQIIADNIHSLFRPLHADLKQWLPAREQDGVFVFPCFGGECRLGPDGIWLDGQQQTHALGVIISLYALWANPAVCVQQPWRAFQDFPDSMPYAGAFAANAQQALVPHMPLIHARCNALCQAFHGSMGPAEVGGDFAFTLHPLPKLALCYIGYLADEEFPAALTCLFSANARQFLPLDALADMAEYTGKRIVAWLAADLHGT